MKTRVLIVDDQSEIRAALRAVIAGEPSFELVGAAEDADEAIELARRHQPDVALVDVKMPAGGGPRAAREIGKCSPATRVVALSVYEDRGSVFQMLQAGAVAYLVKGATADEICDTITRSVRGEAVLSPAVAADVVHELAAHLEQRATLEQRRHEQVERVERALAGGGLNTVFQPIVELATGNPIGFEALTRFTVEPVRDTESWFAEASAVGLRVELELAALRSALAHLDGVPSGAFLAVNLGPGALVAPAVLEALAGVAAKLIVIEATEHAEVEDYGALREALADVRAGGALLAVDDAGAGFASLRHVLRLAPDIIKIDGTLIRELETDRASRALTSALVTFAQEMGQMVIAEGIESKRTIDILEALGVHHGQGYYIARPGELPTLGAA